MPQAVQVLGEADGMVFCPKLGGMGEGEYLFKNAYDGECRKVKRDCCVLGEPKRRKKRDSVVSLDKDHAITGSGILICWDPAMQEIPVGPNPSLEFCPRCCVTFPVVPILTA